MSEAERDAEEHGSAQSDEPPRVESEPSKGLRIGVRCSGRTAVGQVRDHNEDNFVVANLDSGQIRPRDQVCDDEVGERGLIFAVCDGMGGAAAGEVASQMAVDILVEAMRRGGAPKNRDALARRLVGAVEEAGRRIFEAAQKERSRRGMGTTATVAVLVDKVLFLAEVGDSRAYLLRRGQLKQLTKDQSLVNQLIEAGHLTEDEAEAFEHSNIILQALGTSETVQVDLTFIELRRGDRLMMCSDGLSGLVHNDTLRSTLEELKDPAECSAKLIEYAEAAGGHDNITVVVSDFGGEGLGEPAEGEAFGYVQYPLPLADADGGAFADEETTGAGSPLGASRAAERADSAHEEDEGESLLPLAAEPSDTRANVIWILGGLTALAIAGVVWFTMEPSVNDDTQAHPVMPKPAHELKQAPPEEPSEAPAAPEENANEEVDVNVHTDVEKATLLVNGEAKGELSPEQSRSLRLKPGEYKFEAHSAGSQIVTTSVTVKGGTPMDVFLELPKGAIPKEPGQEDTAQKPNGTKAASQGGAESGTAAAAKKPETESTPARHHHSHASEKSAPAEPAVAAGATPEAAPKPAEKAAPDKPPAAPSNDRVSAQRDRSATPAAPPAEKPAGAIPDNPF